MIALGDRIGPDALAGGQRRTGFLDQGLGLPGEFARLLFHDRRVELAGETAFCYAADVEPVLSSLAGQRELVYLHRPANLEDLFLKLAGRQIRDDA